MDNTCAIYMYLVLVQVYESGCVMNHLISHNGQKKTNEVTVSFWDAKFQNPKYAPFSSTIT